jgi:hypothetical protein
MGFLAPLRDDGSPYSLQPFLQRMSTLSLTLGGGHFTTHNPLGGTDRTDSDGVLAGEINIYLRRWLAVTAGIAHGYDVLHDAGVDQATHSSSGFAGLGFRVRDTRFDVSYAQAVREVSGSYAPLRRGNLELSASTVVARRLSATVSATSIPGGGEGSISLEYFPTRSLGLFASGLGAKGELYADSTVVTHYVGSAGIADWFDPTVGLVLQYSLTIEDLPAEFVDQLLYGYHEVSHSILLEVYLRFP